MRDISTQQTLECLASAIKAIEGGHYKSICYFLADANKALDAAGSPYRFFSSGQTRNKGTLAEAVYIKEISVKDVREVNYDELH